MTFCPPIDDLTVKKDQFGRHLLPLASNSGLHVNNGDLAIRQPGYARYQQILQGVKVDGNLLSAKNEQYCFYYYKKEADLVTLWFRWYIQEALVGSAITWDLPFEADPSNTNPANVSASCNAWYIDTGTAAYNRKPAIVSVSPSNLLTRLRLAANDGTLMTSTSPATIAPIDQIHFEIQYVIRS